MALESNKLNLAKINQDYKWPIDGYRMNGKTWFYSNIALTLPTYISEKSSSIDEKMHSL